MIINFNFKYYNMKRHEKFLKLFCVVLCLLGFACNNSNKREKEFSEFDVEFVNDVTKTTEYLADSILTTLTLEERVGQCLMPSINSSSDASTLNKLKKWIEDYHIGGVVLLKGDISSAKQLAQYGAKVKIPLFVAVDAEWGLGMRLKDAKIFPKNGQISKDEEESSLFDYGREVAQESQEIGINMVLGPVLDIAYISRGVIGYRSFGDDPELVADFGVAYAKGIESGGVISVAKHFPGHGSSYNDSHKEVAVVSRDLTTMDSIDLKPFREYINSGLTGIMAGHIQVQSLDPSGRIASVSPDILTSLLREEMGFEGLIITDAFNMGGAKGFSATDALKAGADIILSPDNLEKEYKDIMDNIRNGDLDIAIINERCRKVLITKALFLYHD